MHAWGFKMTQPLGVTLDWDQVHSKGFHWIKVPTLISELFYLELFTNFLQILYEKGTFRNCHLSFKDKEIIDCSLILSHLIAKNSICYDKAFKFKISANFCPLGQCGMLFLLDVTLKKCSNVFSLLTNILLFKQTNQITTN